MPDSTTAAAPAPAGTAPVQFTKPNIYHLQGHQLHITYVPMGAGGKAWFTYQDTNGTRTFSGDQVRTTDTEIGQLVSVLLHVTVDSGSTEFSVLLPTVNLGASKHATIQTEGITTIHRFSIVPISLQGQTELYTFTHLTGTAENAIIPL